MCYCTNNETVAIEVEVTVPEKQTCGGKYSKFMFFAVLWGCLDFFSLICSSVSQNVVRERFQGILNKNKLLKIVTEFCLLSDELQQRTLNKFVFSEKACKFLYIFLAYLIAFFSSYQKSNQNVVRLLTS
jgi:hypothetical protein